MTSPISPVSVPNVSSVNGVARPATPAGSKATDDSGKQTQGFAGAVGDAVANSLDDLASMEQNVEAASQQAAVGSLESVSDFMIATAEAQLATEITVAVRDRAITAFNDIMRMQI